MNKFNGKIGHDCELWIGRYNELAYFDNDDDDNLIGLDGSDCCHEIRSDARHNPLEIVQDIHKIFINQIKNDKEVFDNHWAAGSWIAGQPIGGHIHYELPTYINQREFIQSMDNYLGVICILLENKKHGLKRRGNDYGRFLSYRSKDYGVEQRSLASWLVSPQIAVAILCLAKIISNELINNSNFIPKTYVNATEFNSMQTDIIRPRFESIWNEIKNMELYEEYKDHVEIINYLITNNKTWIPKKSMKECWGLIGEPKVKQVKVNYKFSDIWAEWNKINRQLLIEYPCISPESELQLAA